MDKETAAQINEAAGALSTAAFRIQMDTSKAPDYEVIVALTNRAGKAIAAIRDVLERVPESQR